MNKERVVKSLVFLLNIIVIVLFLLSIVNYQILHNQVNSIVLAWGLIAMVSLVFILEGAPVFVGGSVAVASLLAMGQNPWTILILFLGSAIMGNIFYYYLGYFSGEKILKYFNDVNVKKYKKLFKDYGLHAMIVMAVSPVPYLPTLAGVFKMPKKQMFIETLLVRLIRHCVVFFIWYVILVL